jgi:L-alanine-DL-glutamate epimerase-like enolase superfamily enzyme
MKITDAKVIVCGPGRNFVTLKLITEDGIHGLGDATLNGREMAVAAYLQEHVAPLLIGRDARRIEDTWHYLYKGAYWRRGPVTMTAIAAVDTALWDIQGKALGVPVYQLFGGKLRDRIPVYWSHCGSYRMRNPDICGTPAVKSYEDFTRTGEEVRAKGFTACKTNIAIEVDGKLRAYRPGFVVGKGFPERNWDAFIARSAAKTVEAFRKGCGPDVGVMLDTNFHFRTEGFLQIAEAVGPAKLTWLELDVHDPRSIALIRRDSPCPIASGETLLERRDFRPYFENYAFDTAIVDVIWNGFYESLKIAALADVYEVNVAPHNFYGHLASAISAHFCAAVPNFRIMEIDIDGVPWRDDIVSEPPVFEKGDYVLPKGPGWGVEPNEAAIKARPPKQYVISA